MPSSVQKEFGVPTFMKGQFYQKRSDLSVSITRFLHFTIKKGTPHAVKVTSIEPLKVLSVQAPEFFGKDLEIVKAENISL